MPLGSGPGMQDLLTSIYGQVGNQLSGQLPSQLMRQPVNYPRPDMSGRFNQLANQMAGAPVGSMPNITNGQPPGLRIPTMPMNPLGQIGMTDPNEILRLLGPYYGY